MGSSSLQCGIIGAGIAGLAAAIALRKAGHDVEIYEKSRFKNEVGAALVIQPNATYILRRWGFDFAAARSTVEHGLRGLDVVSGLEQHFVDLEDNQKIFGDDMFSIHRVDFHSQLKSLALAHGAKLSLAKGVADIDADSGKISFEDGTEVQKALVVVASGVHNEWLDKVNGEPSPAKTHGLVYRLLCPLDKVIAIPDSAELYKTDKPVITEVYADNVIVFAYPCRDNTLLNVVVTQPRSGNGVEIRPDQWHVEATKQDVLDIIKDCHPGFAGLVHASEGVAAYPGSYRNPIRRMHHGKVVLIGDAAHAMLPSLGQGAGMAIEDAAALEALFFDWKSGANDIETRLGLFNKLRHPRATVVQIVSNGITQVPMESIHRLCEDFLPSGPFHPLDASHFALSSRKYLYDYDIYEQAAKVLQYQTAQDVPDGLLQYFNEVEP